MRHPIARTIHTAQDARGFYVWCLCLIGTHHGRGSE